MKRKVGRPKANRKPMLVRFDDSIFKAVDNERRKVVPPLTRPAMIRLIVWDYFAKRFVGLSR